MRQEKHLQQQDSPSRIYSTCTFKPVEDEAVVAEVHAQNDVINHTAEAAKHLLWEESLSKHVLLRHGLELGTFLPPYGCTCAVRGSLAWKQ